MFTVYGDNPISSWSISFHNLFLFINANILVVALGAQYDLFSLCETRACFVKRGITQAEGNICSC